MAISMWWLCRLFLSPGFAALALALVLTVPVYLNHLTVGLADDPVASYLTVAALAAFLWTSEGELSWAALSGLSAGAAAWSKLEGAPTGLVILAGAILVLRHDRIRGIGIWLGTFLLFVVPWQIFQRIHHIHFARAHFSKLFLDIPFIARHVAARLLGVSQWGRFWVVCALIILLTSWWWWSTPTRRLAAVTLPNVVATALGYVTHFRADQAVSYTATTSRLYLHIAPAVAVMAAAGLAAAFEGSRRAEDDCRARPEAGPSHPDTQVGRPEPATPT